MSLDFEDAWLEVRLCDDDGHQETEAVISDMLDVPTISEVLEAAAVANRHSKGNMWYFSRRLVRQEVSEILNVLHMAKVTDDSRSISHSLNVSYKGSCYTLTLFEVKKGR
ncbi:MAG TPA: hypothetical protein VNI77_05580 [Nitrososphaera sp.]|nr:hypothetical protein [Nitrososphaera sp.]